MVGTYENYRISEFQKPSCNKIQQENEIHKDHVRDGKINF
jgi:hypothetical protein